MKTTTVYWEVSETAREWIEHQSETLGESTATILDLLIKSYEESVAEG